MRKTRKTMEKVKKAFSPPASLPLGVVTEQPLLAGSVIDAMNDAGVKSAAQELQQYDASSETFNHEWE